jgi:raffinose/stachyose/melibiose transport system substrate-binding protein
MKNFKKVLSILLALTMVMALCACGKSSSESTQTDATTQEEQTTDSTATDSSADTTATDTAASDGLTGAFSVFHFHEDGGAGTSAAFWGEANKFTAANANVTIDYQFTDANDYEEKLTTLMAGDELPDVFLTKGDMLGTLADAGLIQPLDQYIQADADWAASYVDGAFGDCTYNDKQWGAPFQMQANCIGVYNSAIFEECGITSWPETWDELLADCEKIKAAGYTPIAMGNKDKWLAESAVFNTYAYKYVDGDWFSSLKNNQGAKFTDEKFVKALTDFKAIADAGYLNSDVNSINQDEMYALYYNKKAAMFFNGAWSIGTMMANAPADVLESTHLGLMPAVSGEAGTKYNTAAGAGWNYVIKADLSGDNLTAALAFLKQVTTGEYADQALLNGFFSAAKTSGSVDESQLQPLFAEYSDLEATMNFLPIFDCQLPAEIGSGVLFDDTQQLIAGSITPEDMAADCQQTMESNY